MTFNIKQTNKQPVGPSRGVNVAGRRDLHYTARHESRLSRFSLCGRNKIKGGGLSLGGGCKHIKSSFSLILSAEAGSAHCEQRLVPLFAPQWLAARIIQAALPGKIIPARRNNGRYTRPDLIAARGPARLRLRRWKNRSCRCSSYQADGC